MADVAQRANFRLNFELQLLVFDLNISTTLKGREESSFSKKRRQRRSTADVVKDMWCCSTAAEPQSKTRTLKAQSETELELFKQLLYLF